MTELNANLNSVTVDGTERQVVVTQSSKRMLAEISPEHRDTRKIGDLLVDDLKSIIKEGNKEVLDRLDNLSGDVTDLKRQNEMLKQEVEVLKNEKDSDRRRIAQLEDQFKRKNLIFKGVPASNSVNEVKKICNEILEIPEPVILKSTKKLNERDGKVMLLAELDSEQSTIDVLKNTKKLAGTDIYIERDLNVDRQKDKKAMLRLKKEVLSVSKFHRVVVRDDRIRIVDKWFKWSSNKQLMCGTSEAESILKMFYGEKALSINLNYDYLLNRTVSKN